MWPAWLRPHASFVVAALLTFSPAATCPALAQGHDSLLNGAIVGAGIGASAGVAFTHAVRDSDLTAGQYARSALIFGAIGAGAGVGVDALFNRGHHRPAQPQRPRPLFIAPAVWHDLAGVIVKWRW